MKNTNKRRNLIALTVALSALFVSLCGFVAVTGTAQVLKEERKLEDKIPLNVPIKVKVKNLQNEKWVRDLEVEVKNTGDKPIYYIKFHLLVPEAKSPNGTKMGFLFKYGRDEMLDINERATPEDTPINPGETHIFKLEEKFVKPWERADIDPNWRNPKRFVLMFSAINYGDGTGFAGDKPVTVIRASKSSRGRKGVASVVGVTTSTSPPTYFRETSSHLPVRILPANFFPDKADSSSLEPAAPQVDLFCCAGSSCSYIEEVPNGYNC
jgi:hypothetical protein